MTTDDSAADIGVRVAIDGGIGGAGQELQRVGGNEEFPGGVAGHRKVNDDAAVGEQGYPLQEIVHRQLRQIFEPEAAFVQPERLPGNAFPVDVEWRAARDDEDLPGLGMGPEGELTPLRQI